MQLQSVDVLQDSLHLESHLLNCASILPATRKNTQNQTPDNYLSDNASKDDCLHVCPRHPMVFTQLTPVVQQTARSCCRERP